MNLNASCLNLKHIMFQRIQLSYDIYEAGVIFEKQKKVKRNWMDLTYIPHFLLNNILSILFGESWCYTKITDSKRFLSIRHRISVPMRCANND